MTVLLRSVYVLSSDDRGSVAVRRVFLQFQNGLNYIVLPNRTLNGQKQPVREANHFSASSAVVTSILTF